MSLFSKLILTIALFLGFTAFSIDASAESGEDKCATKCSVAKSDGCSKTASQGEACKTEHSTAKSHCHTSHSKKDCQTKCADTGCAPAGCCKGSGESRFMAFIRNLFSS